MPLVSLEARVRRKGDGTTDYIVLTRHNTEDGELISSHRTKGEAMMNLERLKRELDMPQYNREAALRYEDEERRPRRVARVKTEEEKEAEERVGRDLMDKIEGRGRGGLKLLELFKGTGSVGKVAKKMGMSVVSLDLDPIYTPEIETDILKWDYKKWATETGYVPDVIWASPPCNTFSTMAYRWKERNTKTATPYSARAKQGTAILHRTLDIIQYFKRKNPKLVYAIENPRAMMRFDSRLQKEVPHTDTTIYCIYGDVRRKPTDFFNNVGLDLPDPAEHKCKHETINTIKLPLNQRYAIPSKLVKEILTKMVGEYKSK